MSEEREYYALLHAILEVQRCTNRFLDALDVSPVHEVRGLAGRMDVQTRSWVKQLLQYRPQQPTQQQEGRR